MNPTLKPNGKAPPRTRRTRAQIEEDLLASGIPANIRATPAAIKRSCIAAQKRLRCDSAQLPDVEVDGSSTSDGHDHSVVIPVKRAEANPRSKTSVPAPARFSSPDAEELEAYQELFNSQPPQLSVPLSADQRVNAHYRAFLDNDLDSQPPTPKVPEVPSPAMANQFKRPASKPVARRRAKKDTLTAEERMLDDSSEEDVNVANPVVALPIATQSRTATSLSVFEYLSS
ncbi:uncharacterized protein MELLADRAFT_114531 [Melampsora larici-populina 98AG31]|uniref:Uncharacterized protein n=1 Tax=Melampsora larici-populina (strain 98AG31 / pathotype 3-4-7) TaxID=747676 RepID=F4SDU7_MELLP|nr:uncharacterized protein MELLADRAFT_114531 [Melampsora larici-populina 98AG31]EGF97178.1 hypothetical protein MELLADRAFT_114531 [Melampsora larici-populina 98AG31]